MEDSIQTIIAGSAISNAIFGIIYAIGKWLSTRLRSSKCEGHSGCLECETQLTELQTIRETNQVQLEKLRDLQNHILEMKKDSLEIVTLD